MQHHAQLPCSDLATHLVAHIHRSPASKSTVVDVLQHCAAAPQQMRAASCREPTEEVLHRVILCALLYVLRLRVRPFAAVAKTTVIFCRSFVPTLNISRRHVDWRKCCQLRLSERATPVDTEQTH